MQLNRILLRENVSHATSRQAIEFQRHRGILAGGLSELVRHAGATGEVRASLDAQLAGRARTAGSAGINRGSAQTASSQSIIASDWLKAILSVPSASGIFATSAEGDDDYFDVLRNCCGRDDPWFSELTTHRYTRLAQFLLFRGGSSGLANGSFAAGPALPLVFAAGFFVNSCQYCINALAANFYPTGLRSTGVGRALEGRIGSILGPVVAGLLIAAHWKMQQLLLIACIPAMLAAGLIQAIDEPETAYLADLSRHAGSPAFGGSPLLSRKGDM